MVCSGPKVCAHDPFVEFAVAASVDVRHVAPLETCGLCAEAETHTKPWPTICKIRPAPYEVRCTPRGQVLEDVAAMEVESKDQPAIPSDWREAG